MFRQVSKILAKYAFSVDTSKLSAARKEDNKISSITTKISGRVFKKILEKFKFRTVFYIIQTVTIQEKYKCEKFFFVKMIKLPSRNWSRILCFSLGTVEKHFSGGWHLYYVRL